MIRSSTRVSLVSSLKVLALASLVAGCGAEDKAMVATQTAPLASSSSTAPSAERGRPDGRSPEDLVARFDQNHDGKLAISELPERAQQRWAKADANGDGVLEIGELKAAMQAHGAQRFAQADKNGDGKLTEAEVGAEHWRFLSRADANGDKAVTKEELEQAHQQGRLGPGGPRGRHGEGRGRMFERFDKNGDGRLTSDETPARVWEHLKVADANQDGALTREELQAARSQGKLVPPVGKAPPPNDQPAPAK